MPLRRLTPLTFKPKGLSDAIDGTNAFPGAMSSLSNLVHAPSTESVFVPRAAATELTAFAGFNTPGQLSALQVIGTRVYGMVASARYAGNDEPFCYDMIAQAFIAIGNVTAANTPTSPAATGDWTPPTIADITNGRIIFTHPGFSGGAGNYFGWIDLSSAAITTLKGDLTSGSNVITSINDGSTSAPINDGVEIGYAISGSGIPAGSYVTGVTNGTFDLSTTGNTNGTTTLASVANLTGVAVGMLVSGPQFAAGTTVAALPGGGAVTLSTAALGTATGTTVNFTGGGTITISQNATATTNSVALDITGGTSAAPVWGAGNTNGYPLPAVPTAVAQFNSRAYYAVDNSLVFSDTLNPTQVSNLTSLQVLTLGDSTPVTALAGTPLTSTLTGGIIQSLTAFKGAENFYQITGDAATSNLVQNVVSGSVGTLAPNTICETPLGLAFIAPDGLRILGPTGLLTEPIGVNGKGVSTPFIDANYPSRMCAAYGQNTLRISVQNADLDNQPYQEYFFNFSQKAWTGPHTFPSSLISYYASNTTVGFVCAPQSVTGSLWFHSITPNQSSIYTENNMSLTWNWQTILLPDNQQLSMNAVNLMTLGMVLPPGQEVTLTAFDESGAVLSTVGIEYVNPANEAIWDQTNWDSLDVFNPVVAPVSATWGGFNWGSTVWGNAYGYYQQRRIPWTQPLVFKQGSVQVVGDSATGFAIGNLYMGYQILGYLLEDGL